MPKTPKRKKAPKAKAQRTKKKVPTIHIKIGDTKGTAQDFEQAITAKLETEPTNLFRDNRTIKIVIEKFGGRPE